MKEIRDRIILLRKVRELTQEGLAEKMGVSRDTIARIERGKGGIDLGRLSEIARALEISLSYLLGMQEPEKWEPEFLKFNQSKKHNNMENVDQRIDKIQDALKEQAYLNDKIVSLLEKMVDEDRSNQILGLVRNVANRLSVLEIAFNHLEEKFNTQDGDIENDVC